MPNGVMPFRRYQAGHGHWGSVQERPPVALQVSGEPAGQPDGVLDMSCVAIPSGRAEGEKQPQADEPARPLVGIDVEVLAGRARGHVARVDAEDLSGNLGPGREEHARSHGGRKPLVRVDRDRVRPPDAVEDKLTAAVIALASEYGRYGDKKIAAMLQSSGWKVGRDRVERIWRREGLQVSQKQRPRRRLWFNDGSCVRLRPERANHVWRYEMY